MNYAIIPARGGSKRIPNKNIKFFHGKPIIAWSIEQARQSQCFDDVIVSTDSEEIAEIAMRYGASVPFLRPPELADDFTGTADVIAHAIDWLHKYQNIDIQFACCIYATAPFITALDLQLGLKILCDSKSEFVFSITNFPFPIQRALRLDAIGNVSMFNQDMFNVRSQDLEEAWHDAGQFYWGKSTAWLNKKPIFNANSKGVKIPSFRAQDIDNPEDWIRAELLFKINMK